MDVWVGIYKATILERQRWRQWLRGQYIPPSSAYTLFLLPQSDGARSRILIEVRSCSFSGYMRYYYLYGLLSLLRAVAQSPYSSSSSCVELSGGSGGSQASQCLDFVCKISVVERAVRGTRGNCSVRAIFVK